MAADLSLLYLIAAILIGGAALAKVAEEYRFPYPIPLIIAGLVLGIAFGSDETILPADFGMDFLAQLTLAAVLFYAGLTMNLKETNRARTSIVLLATLGVLLTAVIAGVTVFAIIPSLGLALLIGSILSPTDPAALFSVLESGGVRVKRKLFTLLEGEAVFNDATAVVLVITVFEPQIIPALREPWFIMVLDFILSMGLGVLIGYAVAYGIGRMIHRTGEDTNISILTATTPILAYGLGEAVSGLLYPIIPGVHPGALACVFAGIFMANAKMVGISFMPRKSMRGVMKNVSFVFEIAVYVLFGFFLDVSGLLAVPNLILYGVLAGLLVIFVARPVSVLLVTLGDKTVDMKERFLLSWAGVKGVASAALAAIAVGVIFSHAESVNGFFSDHLSIPTEFLDLYPGGLQYPFTEYVVLAINSIVFIVIMMSLVIQGLTTPILTRRLGLVEEKDRAQDISIERNATRQALLYLVDQYTEGKIDSKTYLTMKRELEEEIFTLEDELRVLVAERRARVKELAVRSEIVQKKLDFINAEFEKGNLSEAFYSEACTEMESEIEELETRKQMQ
jgi:cell volume regulation protein A